MGSALRPCTGVINIDLAGNCLGDYGATVLGDALKVACAGARGMLEFNCNSDESHADLSSIYLTTILASMALL